MKERYSDSNESGNDLIIGEKFDESFMDKGDKSLLKNVNIVNISSGASTPAYIVDEIIEYLKKYEGQ